MENEKAEGVILHALNFRDYDQILTIFTYNEGVVKGVAKGALRPSSSIRFATAPLTRIEFLYTKGKSDLLKCSELTSISQYLPLRSSLPRLQAACDVVQAISRSQLPHHPAPDLYKLFLWTLDKIPVVADPFLLAISFQLKLLRHDGVLSMQCRCAVCGKEPAQGHILKGEVLCQEHCPYPNILFTNKELKMLELLAHLRHISDIAEERSTVDLRQKVNTLFFEQT